MLPGGSRAAVLRGAAQLVILTSALCATAPSAAAQTATEYQVKAAFLYHFAQLVSWPGGEADPQKPIVIAILGRDPFGGVIDATVGGRNARGRPLRVVRAQSAAELREPSDIAFVGAADLADAERIVAGLAVAPVLTVGELPGITGRACMIGFRLTEDGRVSFDVNLRLAERAGLRLSSQLLKVARSVESRP